MRGSMWWIDRWRQSDAYARMTAEEQGLYRNLCDEVVLRESGVIPDDQRILAKASGDHEAWARSGQSVLKSMTLVDGGWTNETAMEVKTESARRSKKQRDYRNGLGNASGNGSGNSADNEVRPPYQDQEQILGNGKGPRPVTKDDPGIPSIDRLNEDFEFEESRFTSIMVRIRDSGQDVQEALDALPRKSDRSPMSAFTWLRNGRSGIQCSAGGLTVLRLTCDALEARARAQERPNISDSNRETLENLKRAGDRIRARQAQQPKPREITG
jgi:hypothetical protein